MKSTLGRVLIVVVGVSIIIGGVILEILIRGNQDLNRSIGGLQFLMMIGGLMIAASPGIHRLYQSHLEHVKNCQHTAVVKIGVKTIRYGASPATTQPWYQCQNCGKTLD